MSILATILVHIVGDVPPPPFCYCNWVMEDCTPTSAARKRGEPSLEGRRFLVIGEGFPCESIVSQGNDGPDHVGTSPYTPLSAARPARQTEDKHSRDSDELRAGPPLFNESN